MVHSHHQWCSHEGGLGLTPLLWQMWPHFKSHLYEYYKTCTSFILFSTFRLILNAFNWWVIALKYLFWPKYALNRLFFIEKLKKSPSTANLLASGGETPIPSMVSGRPPPTPPPFRNSSYATACMVIFNSTHCWSTPYCNGQRLSNCSI